MGFPTICWTTAQERGPEASLIFNYNRRHVFVDSNYIPALVFAGVLLQSCFFFSFFLFLDPIHELEHSSVCKAGRAIFIDNEDFRDFFSFFYDQSRPLFFFFTQMHNTRKMLVDSCKWDSFTIRCQEAHSHSCIFPGVLRDINPCDLQAETYYSFDTLLK